MGLKDVSKIVANQVGREKALEEANAPAVSSQSAQFAKRTDELSKSIKPGTSKPADVTGHKGFKYDSNNPIHKDLVSTLLKSGDLGKLTIHEGGAVSLPKEVAYKEGISGKFLTSAETSGGEKSYGEAAKLAKRPSEKAAKAPSSRPVGPVEAVARKIGTAENLTVDQQRSAKRREMELRQEKINENIRRKRGEK